VADVGKESSNVEKSCGLLKKYIYFIEEVVEKSWFGEADGA